MSFVKGYPGQGLEGLHHGSNWQAGRPEPVVQSSATPQVGQNDGDESHLSDIHAARASPHPEDMKILEVKKLVAKPLSGVDSYKVIPKL